MARKKVVASAAASPKAAAAAAAAAGASAGASDAVPVATPRRGRRAVAGAAAAPRESLVRRFLTTFSLMLLGAWTSSTLLYVWFGPNTGAPASIPAAATGAADADADDSAALDAFSASLAARHFRWAGAVERVDLNGAEFDAAAIVTKYTHPVVLRGTPTDHWAAREQWTAEYLTHNIAGFRNIYYRNTETNHSLPPAHPTDSSGSGSGSGGGGGSGGSSTRAASGRVFGPIHYHTQPMNALDAVRWRNPHAKVNLTSQQFLKKVTRNSNRHTQLLRRRMRAAAAHDGDATVTAGGDAEGDAEGDMDRGEFAYYVGRIEELAAGGSALDEDSLFAAVSPMAPFLLTPQQSQVNVWIGQSGVFAHMHYDSYINFNAQLFGRKRFWLFPPSHASSAYLYPFLHPSHAQSQVDLLSGDASGLAERFPLLRDLTGYEAVLTPGDVLYIPPLWLHAVEALSLSVSVNMWSLTAEAATVEQVMAVVRDTVVGSAELHKPSRNRRTVARYLIAQALRRVHARAPLILLPHSAAPDSGGDNSAAARFVRQLIDERFARLIRDGDLSDALPDGVAAADFCPAAPPSAAARALLDPAVDRIAALLARLPDGNRDIWVGNFVENIAFWGADTHTVTAFIVRCLQTPPSR